MTKPTRSKAVFQWLFRRALAVILPLTLLIALLCAGIISHIRHGELRDQIRMMACEKAVRLAGSNADEFDEQLRALALASGVAVQFIDSDGTVRGDPQFGEYQATRIQEQPDVVAARLTGYGYHEREIGGQTWQFAAVEVSVESGRGTGILRFHRAMDPLQDQFLSGGIKISFAAALILALLTSVIMARLLGRRLNTAFESYDSYVRQLGEPHGIQSLAYHQEPAFREFADTLVRRDREIGGRLRSLEQEHRQLEVLFSTMRDGVLAVDENGNLVLINQGACRLLNVSLDNQTLGEPLYLGVRNAELHLTLRQFLESDDEFFEGEIEVRRTGETCAIRVRAGRYAADATVKPGVLMVLSDVTAIRRLERIRREFVANVSHELKTPLTSISGSLETLSMCMDDDVEQAKRFVNIISRQTDRMQAIVSDLLALSRLEQDASVFQPEFREADLQAAIAQAIEQCHAVIREGEYDVQLSTEPVMVRGHHGLLVQAIGNLVENAAKYGRQAGRIEVSTRMVDGSVELTVSDDGPGIPPEHRDRVFERFYRVDPARDRGSGGSGLGLAIVKHIVLLHGGEVSVDSTVKQGSAFHMTLPCGTSNDKEDR